MPGDGPGMIDPELLRLASQYHCDIIATSGDDPREPARPRPPDAFPAPRREPSSTCTATRSRRALAGEDLSQDLPKGHIDIPKLERGGVDLQVFACFAPPPANEAEKGRSGQRRLRPDPGRPRARRQEPEQAGPGARRSQDASDGPQRDKTGVLIGIEGGYAIENDLALLREFHRAGVRLMTLTHWTATDWADASGDPKPVHGGLTEFGEKVVAEMNALGMIVDVSHAADETFWDVLRVSKAPVVASHSGCRALAAHHRNLSDEMLKALAEKNGVIGINFWPGFLQDGYDKAKQTAIFEKVAADHGLPADWAAIVTADAGRAGQVLRRFPRALGRDQEDAPAGRRQDGRRPHRPRRQGHGRLPITSAWARTSTASSERAAGPRQRRPPPEHHQGARPPRLQARRHPQDPRRQLLEGLPRGRTKPKLR